MIRIQIRVDFMRWVYDGVFKKTKNKRNKKTEYVMELKK